MSLSHPFFEQPYAFHNTSAKHHDLIQWYLKSSIEDYTEKINHQKSTYWMEKSESRTLEFFHQAAQLVPAYKDLLLKEKIDHTKVHTIDDFKKYVPVIDKKNYIYQYSLSEMSWHGRIESNVITSFSSGTSGSASYWPRSTYQDIEGAFMFEQFLCDVFQINKKSSLIVICFALGNYVAGTYVLSCLQWLSQKGYNFMIVSPGINQSDVFRMVTKLSPNYDQTILCGYPPLLRDMIHAGDTEGIPWGSYNLRFLFSSELFSEVWRDRVLTEASTPLDLRNSTNLYGTADATLFGLENPINILVKKESQRNSTLHNDIFHENLTPTFIQYNPMLRYFEVVDGELVLSSQSGLPLLRYNLHDKGGVISHENLLSIAAEHGLQLEEKLREIDCEDTLIHFPHVYCFSRTDGAVSLYGLLLYPEYVKSGIEDDRVQEYLSGKFTLSVEQENSLSPELTVHIELSEQIDDISDKLALLQQTIIEHLRRKSAEYNRLLEAVGEKAHPVIKVYKFGEHPMFHVQIKQTWIKKKK